MMMRLLLLFVLAIAPASAATVTQDPAPVRIPNYRVPRGHIVTSYVSEVCMRSHGLHSADRPGDAPSAPVNGDVWENYPGKFSIATGICVVVEFISTGRELVPLESSEGQRVLDSIAVPNAGQSRW